MIHYYLFKYWNLKKEDVLTRLKMFPLLEFKSLQLILNALTLALWRVKSLFTFHSHTLLPHFLTVETNNIIKLNVKEDEKLKVENFFFLFHLSVLPIKAHYWSFFIPFLYLYLLASLGSPSLSFYMLLYTCIVLYESIKNHVNCRREWDFFSFMKRS